jgi:hypothetical protein
MKSMTFMVVVVAVTMFGQCAHAREHHHHYAYGHHRHGHLSAGQNTFTGPQWNGPGNSGSAWFSPATNEAYASASGTSGFARRASNHGRDHGRPRAWCGWEMRRLVGADPGPSYNLARNWAHWGRSGPAGIGAVVVWPHHVGKIVGQENGQWIIESGNDGHALRSRARSIAGAIAIRWG